LSVSQYFFSSRHRMQSIWASLLTLFSLIFYTRHPTHFLFTAWFAGNNDDLLLTSSSLFYYNFTYYLTFSEWKKWGGGGRGGEEDILNLRTTMHHFTGKCPFLTLAHFSKCVFFSMMCNGSCNPPKTLHDNITRGTILIIMHCMKIQV
jgi:hypothetical protein